MALVSVYKVNLGRNLMILVEFGECFELDCHKEVMSYEIYTYENVSMGACRIQDAIDVLKT